MNVNYPALNYEVSRIIHFSDYFTSNLCLNFNLSVRFLISEFWFFMDIVLILKKKY